MTQVPSLVNVVLEVVLSRHDVNVVYRPEHCGQSGDISDGDDSDDGEAMVSPLLMCHPASHYHSSSSWELPGLSSLQIIPLASLMIG